MSESRETDPTSVFAEAEARISRAAEEGGEVLDFSDLQALQNVPDLARVPDLREFYLGIRIATEKSDLALID